MQNFTSRKFKLALIGLLTGILGACAQPVSLPPSPPTSSVLPPSPPGQTPAQESSRWYQRARAKYAEGRYEESLALISRVRTHSNPPRLDRAEAMVLNALWGRVIDRYTEKNYDGALETIAILEKRSRPPKLALAKQTVLSAVKARGRAHPPVVPGAGPAEPAPDGADSGIPGPINTLQPRRLPMDIYGVFRNNIYMTGETLTTDSAAITFDSFRLDLGDVSLGPPGNVTFTLRGPSGEVGRVAKGTRELEATPSADVRSKEPARGRTFKNLKISGLVMGPNRLTVTALDRLGRKQSAHVIIQRIGIGYQKFAILMGVREYPWDPHWEANFVDRDLAGLKGVLIRQGYRVRTVVNPTIDQLEMMIRRLRSPDCTFTDDGGKQIALGDNDDVIVYYSGHGFRVNPGMPNEFGYLVPYGAIFNADRGRPQDEGCLPMDDLVNSLKFSRSRHKLLILDTCYAALAGTAKSPPHLGRSCDRKYLEQRGLFLMAASERDEKSWMYRHMRQSAFTRLLVDALNGQAHVENGGCLTLFDIAGYITGRLENQNPVFRFLSNGNGMPYFEKFNN